MYEDQPNRFTFLSLFSGIGGFDLGLEKAGWNCIGQVEIDPFCQCVLEHHWPCVKRVGDIKIVEGNEFNSPLLVCGGFPCQPFSCAGKRKGKSDDRYLWPQMLRIVKAVRPPWVLGENVAGIIRMELDTVLSDLESQGYACRAFVIPACAVDAPHRRDRVWIVAYSERNQHFRSQRCCTSQTKEMAHLDRQDDCSSGKPCGTSPLQCARQDDVPDSPVLQRETFERNEPNRILPGNVANPSCKRIQRNRCAGQQKPGTLSQEELSHGNSQTNRTAQWEPEPSVGRLVDGVPNRVAQLRSLGNAVVPKVVEVLGRAIIEAERMSEILANSDFPAEVCLSESKRTHSGQ